MSGSGQTPLRESCNINNLTGREINKQTYFSSIVPSTSSSFHATTDDMTLELGVQSSHPHLHHRYPLASAAHPQATLHAAWPAGVFVQVECKFLLPARRVKDALGVQHQENSPGLAAASEHLDSHTPTVAGYSTCNIEPNYSLVSTRVQAHINFNLSSNTNAIFNDSISSSLTCDKSI